VALAAAFGGDRARPGVVGRRQGDTLIPETDGVDSEAAFRSNISVHACNAVTFS
jgi:hypothetical protein